MKKFKMLSFGLSLCFLMGGVAVLATGCDDGSSSTFSGGTGTEANPYIISNEEEWLSLSDDENSDLATGGYHFKVTADLDLSGETENYCIESFNGYVDFDNHTVTVSENSLYAVLFWRIEGGDTEISNLNIACNGVDSALSIYLDLYDGNITLSNITINGTYYQTDNNTTPFCWGVFGYGNENVLTFKNCTNNATITAISSCAGIFLGKVYEDTKSLIYDYAYVVFDTCVNNGTLYHAQGYSGMLISNGTTFTHNNNLEYFTVKNCVNYGTIYGVTGAGLFCGIDRYYDADGNISSASTGTSVRNYSFFGKLKNNTDATDGKTVGVCEVKTPGEIETTTVNEKTAYNLSALQSTEDGHTYSVFFSFWVNVYDDAESTSASNWGACTITVTTSATTLSDITLYVYDWIAADASGSTSTPATTEDSGATYYVFDTNGLISWYNYTTTSVVKLSNIKLMVYDYDSTGSLSNLYSTSCTAATLVA